MATQRYGFLAKDNNNVDLQAFSPTAVVTITAAGDVDVTDYNCVMFDTAVTIYLDSDSSNTFNLAAYVPLGCVKFESIHVNAACGMLTM